MAEEKAELIVYNSLTKQKEVFKPKVAGKVGMYVCGVTAYDYSHIGHARAYVAFDILYRYLRHLGYEVMYVRNFTDVDDKIIKRANERGVDPISLSAEFCQEFLKDMADLQCLLPTHQPRVSDHMEKIIDMISQIENNGCAYRVEGDVYFSVDNSPKYGQLSGRKLEDNRSGERVAVDSRKRNPADFALWKSAKDGEPSWESPWGPGRPGWHIECSAMSAEYLTPIFDIHGGGMDLIFPHHENEIAQSCAACPESNVSYWMHNGFVTTNDEKMSKSLGNFFTIRKVTELYHPLALRHFLLGTHYRSPVNYSIAQIEIASEAVYRFYQTLQDCQDALSLYREGSADTVAEPTGKKVRITDAASECIHNLQSDVQKMSDDLHTYSLLNSALPEALKLINSSLTLLKKKQQQKQKQSVIQSLIELEKEVRDALDILGLLSSLEYPEVLGQLKSKALKRSGFEDDYIEDQIKERAFARKNKEFSRGDKIRSELAAKGIALMDVGSETIWRPCVPVQQEQLGVPKEAKPCEDAEKQKQAQLVQVKPEEPLPKEQDKSSGVEAVKEKTTLPTAA
ncbi:Cysteine--tRNA ligase [Heracleum sosnowskyi]|uniref:cysteine--tRNA ligase n=1 Tax=Heracleum sosnowskyi TaxID=360622 RepID=A0AAD8IRY2_9APIA|nr:Cysteine--tRNA ligase [Heracleum sosnowskyi]